MTEAEKKMRLDQISEFIQEKVNDMPPYEAFCFLREVRADVQLKIDFNDNPEE